MRHNFPLDVFDEGRWPLEELLSKVGYRKYNIYKITYADGCFTQAASRYALAGAIVNAGRDEVYHGEIIKAELIRQREV